MAKVIQAIKQNTLIDSKSGNDTIRLWEGHREQAMLWRAIALLQIPATAIAIIFALVMWLTRSVVLNVPAKPLPGTYLAQEIPDTEFIDFASNYVNLTTTYQPSVAQRQYLEARKLLWEPMISRFDIEMLNSELKAIQTTSRTQIFFVDPTKTSVKREGKKVIVSMSGDRLKMIAGKELPSSTTTYTITLGTVPRNSTSPYGIVITDVDVQHESSRS